MCDNKCECRICWLIRRLQSLEKKATEKEKEAINEVWCRMSCAETELAVQQAKREGKWPEHADDEIRI